MPETPLLSLDRGKGLHLDLYPNRLVVIEGAWPLGKKEETIPVSRIASLTVDRLGWLKIETTGGKQYKWMLGPQAKDLKAAIEQNL